MDPSFIPVEVVPSKTPFGLDQLRRSYKTALDAASAIAAAPVVGTADEVFPNMFLMPVNTPESAESATRVELVYMGSFQGAEGSPVLPDQKHDDNDSVQSASSSRNLASQTVSSPVNVQYYAPNSVLTWFTFGAKGVKGTASDPERDIEIITVALNDTTFSYSSGGMDALVNNFFTRQITSTIESQEIVPGQYWVNTERRTLGLVPYIVDLAPGFYPAPYNGGNGYTVGDTITLSFSGTCVMTVQAVRGATTGSIAVATIVSNSLSVATSIPQSVTGGTGTGAKYTVIEVT